MSGPFSVRLHVSRLTEDDDTRQAPLTEEIVFRSCMIAVAQLSGASHKHLIFVTPLWFGLGEGALV